MKTLAIDQLLRTTARHPEVISFAGGLPASHTFPKSGLAQAATAAILEMQEALRYDWPEGRRSLREQIAERLRTRGVDVEGDEVIVTNGAQDGLGLVFDLLKPSVVQVDAETYPGALDLFRRHRCSTTTANAALRYTMPALQNPIGHTATPAERAQLLQSSLIIEDDAYAELLFDSAAPRPLLADARQRVFHLGTFSKIVSPGLRVGWLVPPRRWLSAARELKSSRDLQASGLCQALVEQLLSSPHFDARLESLRTHYRQRAEQLLAQLPMLRNVHFAMPQGGFSVWVETECYGIDETLLRHGLSRGVAFDPGCLFRASPRADQVLAFRLSFSSVPEDRMAAGLERLATTLEDFAPRRRHSAA